MKNATKILALSILIAVGTAGCFDGGDSGGDSAPLPDAIAGKVVVKAALIDALWGLADEPDPDAVCVANSTLSFDASTSFMIIKAPAVTEYNQTPVSVVSSINILFPDHTTDGRSPECGTEPLRYIVTASEQAPIDIEVAEAVAVRQNLESKAGTTPTPYPTSCMIKAHFEKSGTDELLEATEPDENEETEEKAVEDDDQTAEEEDNSGMNASADYDDEEAEETEEAEDEAAEEDNPEDEETEEESFQYPQQGVYSLKLVIDDYDCTPTSLAPTPYMAPTPNN